VRAPRLKLKPNAALLATLLLASPCWATPTPVEQGLRDLIYRFGEGYTQAAIDLAAPAKVKASKADGGTVRKDFQGPGIQASWLESPSMPGKPTPVQLRVSRTGHLVSDIHVGTSSPADIQSLLGAPDERGNQWMAYRGLAEICSDKFTFRFAGGKLSEVEWQWCAD